jgi:hypothetical protein
MVVESQVRRELNFDDGDRGLARERIIFRS